MQELLYIPKETHFTTVDGVQPYYHKYTKPISKIEYSDTVYNTLHNGIDTVWTIEADDGTYDTAYQGRTPTMKFYYGRGVPEAALNYKIGRGWGVKYKAKFTPIYTGNHTFYFQGQGKIIASLIDPVTSGTIFSTTYSIYMNTDYYTPLGPYNLKKNKYYDLNIEYQSSKKNNDAGFIGLFQTDSASVTPEKVVISGSVAHSFVDSVLPYLIDLPYYMNISCKEREGGSSELTFELPFIDSSSGYTDFGYYYDEGSDSYIEKNSGLSIKKYRQIRYSEGYSNSESNYAVDGLTAGYINVPYDVSLACTAGVTLEAWIKPHSGCVGIIVGKNKNAVSDGQYEYAMRIGTNGYLRFHVYGYDTSYSGEVINTNESWRHIVLTADGSLWKYYIDGVNVKTIENDYLPQNTLTNDLGILARHDGSVPISIVIDELKIYNRAIRPDEVLYSYNMGNGKKEPYDRTDLKLFMRFNEGSGQYVSDESIYSNTGVITTYSNAWVTGKVHDSGEYYSKFTGQIRDIDIQYNNKGEDTIKITCNDYSVFTKDSINLISPTPIDYWQAGYITESHGVVNGITKPRAFDGWEPHKVYETILTDCGIDPASFYNRKQYANYNYISTSGGFLIELLNLENKIYLNVSQNYGIPIAGEAEIGRQDDPYAYSISSGEYYQDFIEKTMKSFYYRWGFNSYGSPYLKLVDVPNNVINGSEFDFSPTYWSTALNTQAINGVYFVTNDQLQYASVDAVGKKFELILGRGPTVSTCNVILKHKNSGTILVDTNYRPYYSTSAFYYDGPDSTGINGSILTLANGLQYDTYTILIANNGVSSETRLNALLCYDEDYDVPSSVFYAGDSTYPGTVLTLSVKYDIDSQRSDCVVLGRRTGTLVRLDAEGNEIAINKNNPTFTYIQSSSRDLNAVYKSTSSNYIGRSRPTIIIDPSIMSQEQADFISYNFIQEFNEPKKQVSFSLPGTPHLEVGDCIAIIDSFKMGINSSDYVWITEIDTNFDSKYETRVVTSPTKPVNSFYPRPAVDLSQYGEEYIWNFKSLYSGFCGQLYDGGGLLGDLYGCEGSSGDNFEIKITKNSRFFNAPTNNVLQYIVPTTGYFKIGEEIIKYDSADVTSDANYIRLKGITRNVPYGGLDPDSSSLNVIKDMEFTHWSSQGWKSSETGQLFYGDDCIIGFLPYSESSWEPSIEFDLLVDADVEISVANYVNDSFYAVENSIEDFTLDYLTNLDNDDIKNADNYKFLSAGHYKFSWGGFDRLGDYNEKVKDEEDYILKSSFYAQPNYKNLVAENVKYLFLPSSSKVLEKLESVNNGFGLFYYKIKVRPRYINNGNLKLYHSLHNGDWQYNDDVEQNLIKTILIDPGYIDLTFSTSGMYYATASDMITWTGDWGYKAYAFYPRSNRETGEFNYDRFRVATNYPVVASVFSGSVQNIPSFITNNSNPHSITGISQGAKFTISTYENDDNDNSIIRRFLPNLQFMFVQIGIITDPNAAYGVSCFVNKNIGDFSEASDVDFVSPGQSYYLNLNRWAEGKDIEFCPKQWSDLLKKNTTDEAIMWVCNYLLFIDKVYDLSGRKVNQVKSYKEYKLPYSESQQSIYTFDNTWADNDNHHNVNSDPEVARKNLYNLGLLPYGYTTNNLDPQDIDVRGSSLKTNRGLYEFSESSETRTWRYYYAFLDPVLNEWILRDSNLDYNKNLKGEFSNGPDKTPKIYRNNFVHWADNSVIEMWTFDDMVTFSMGKLFFAIYNALLLSGINVPIPNFFFAYRKKDFI